jgi:hypothetical protein
MNFDKREIGRHPHVGISAPICANFKQLIIQLLGLIAHYAVVRLGGVQRVELHPWRWTFTQISIC